MNKNYTHEVKSKNPVVMLLSFPFYSKKLIQVSVDLKLLYKSDKLTYGGTEGHEQILDTVGVSTTTTYVNRLI